MRLAGERLLLGLALVLATPALADEPAAASKGAQRQQLLRRTLRNSCSATWPRNEKRQKKCFDDQVAAGNEFNLIARRFPPESEGSADVRICMDRWVRPEVGRLDFRQAVRCLNFEIEKNQNRR